MAAAVADYRPENTADSKIKKENTNEITIKLVKIRIFCLKCVNKKRKPDSSRFLCRKQ